MRCWAAVASLTVISKVPVSKVDPVMEVSELPSRAPEVVPPRRGLKMSVARVLPDVV